MSWDWVERDLTEWAKRTLPEFLLISMQDPNNKDECIARTPWESFVVCVAEVQIDGEANLTGRKSQSLFQFDLDIGIRIDIEKEGKDAYWPGVVQMVHFENCNLTPEIITRLEEVPASVGNEVGWYVKEGMGKKYIWHGLARWHAYAVRKWTQADPPRVLDPYSNPEPAPRDPPFAVPASSSSASRGPPGARKEAVGAPEAPRGGAAGAEKPRSNVPFIGKKSVHPVESSDASDNEDPQAAGTDGARGRRRRPAAWPEEEAGAEGETGTLALTSVDMALNKARKKKEEYEVAAYDRRTQLRAAELCKAIEAGDIMKAFAKLDDETVDCPHPDTGLFPVHCCVVRGSKELLQMMIEGKADLNRKDPSGQTPLMAAAKAGSKELVKLLLDSGADAAEEDSFGRTAADMVAAAEKEEPAEDRPLKNWKEKLSGEPTPQEPGKCSNELRDLIDERERPKKYGTLLLTAMGQKDFRTAETAIEAGGDVNMVDDKGETPLLLLAKGKWKDQEPQQVRLAEKACKAGADVNAQNAQGNAPLLYAAHRGNLRLVEALLLLGADTSIANGEGNTALMYAAHGGHEAICTALLEAFSPATAKNKFGLTAAETALRRGFKSCAVLVQAYEMAPKKADSSATGESSQGPRKEKKKQEGAKLAFDYSKWNALEKEMQEDEAFEETTRTKEQQDATKRPVPKIEDLGPEAFGLPANTPWPPPDPAQRRKGPFDYSRWDKIVDDIERRDKVRDRYDELQRNPQYEWRDGQKLQVLF